jgi:hypothetical protein
MQTAAPRSPSSPRGQIREPASGDLRVLRLGRHDKMRLRLDCPLKLLPALPESSWSKIHLAHSEQIEGHEASWRRWAGFRSRPLASRRSSNAWKSRWPSRADDNLAVDHAVLGKGSKPPPPQARGSTGPSS